MAAYFKKEDLDGFANFFVVQAEEERFHAMKFFEYISDQGEEAVITGFKDPKRDFKSVEEIFALALEHEQLVSSLDVYCPGREALSEYRLSTVVH